MVVDSIIKCIYWGLEVTNTTLWLQLPKEVGQGLKGCCFIIHKSPSTSRMDMGSFSSLALLFITYVVCNHG